MNKKGAIMRPVGMVLALLVFSAALMAGGPFPQVRNKERIRENLLTLRLLRMTQALDLDEGQSAKIYPTINRIEKEKMDIQRQLGPEIEGLRAAVLASKPDEADIAARTGRVRAFRDRIKAKDEEIEAFLDANLTLVQKAKYLIFSVDFYRGLGQVLDRARRPALADRREY